MSDALADRCECAYADDRPPELPVSVAYAAPDWIVAAYHCGRCHRSWRTSWGAEACGWPVLPPPRQAVPASELIDDLIARLRAGEARSRLRQEGRLP